MFCFSLSSRNSKVGRMQTNFVLLLPRFFKTKSKEKPSGLQTGETIAKRASPPLVMLRLWCTVGCNYMVFYIESLSKCYHQKNREAERREKVKTTNHTQGT